MLALAHEGGGSPELIVVGSFPGKPSFRGLGELTAEELETLWPMRRAATADTLGAAVTAWEAFRAPDPTMLAEFAGRGSSELPFLAPALRRLLEELPDATDGLSWTERRAMQAIATGAGTPAAAFVAAQRLEEAPFLGDAWFYRVLASLGRGPIRLVETQDGSALPEPPPLSDGQRFSRLSLRLSSEGEHVLRSAADRVDLLGIDRWVGGTHITPENLWRWDRSAEALVSPPGRRRAGTRRK